MAVNLLEQTSDNAFLTPQNSGNRKPVNLLADTPEDSPTEGVNLLAGVNAPKQGEISYNSWELGLLQNFAHNQKYAKIADYNTPLSPSEEDKFRQWISDNDVNFDPDATIVDYDMRGYWLARQKGKSRGTVVNKVDGKLHYPDTFKTPFDRTFSNESKYATKDAPHWSKTKKGYDVLVSSDGEVVFDPTKQSEDNSYKAPHGLQRLDILKGVDPFQGTFTSKKLADNIVSLWNHNMFVNIAKDISGHTDFNDKAASLQKQLTGITDQMQEMVASGNVDRDQWRKLVADRQAVSHAYNTLLQDQSNTGLEKLVDDPIGTTLKYLSNLKDQVTGDPIGVAADLFDSMVQDPELIAIGGGELSSIAKVAGASKVAEDATKVARAASKISLVTKAAVREGLVGGAVMAPVDIAEQINSRGNIYVPKLVGDVSFGVASGVGLGTLVSSLHSLGLFEKAAEATNKKPRIYRGIDKRTGKPRYRATTPKEIKAMEDHFRANVENDGVTSALASLSALIGEKIPDDVVDAAEAAIKTRDDSNVVPPAEPNYVEEGATPIPVDESGRPTVRGMNHEDIDKLVFEDSLTGLPNIRAFEAKEPSPYIAILDLDDFKQINDTQGHPAGDAHIKTASQIVRSAAGDGNIFRPHQGGDEFYVTGDNPQALAHTLDAANALLTKRTGHGFSYGVARYGEARDLRPADEALYRNKAERTAKGLRNPRQADELPPGVPQERRAFRGKPVKETSDPRIKIQKEWNKSYTPKRQRGAITPRNATVFGAGVVGAGVGYSYSDDHKYLAGAVGYIGGATAAAILIAVLRAARASMGEAVDKAAMLSNRSAFEEWEQATSIIPFEAARLRYQLKKAHPDLERREAMSMYMHGDKSVELSPAERETIAGLRGLIEEVGERAKKSKLIKDTIQSFFPRFWVAADKASDKIKAKFARQISSASKRRARPLSTSSTHRLIRQLPPGMAGFEIAIERGLLPRTLDISEIAPEYLQSMGKAIVNDTYIRTMKGLKSPDGTPLLMPVNKAPVTYVPARGPFSRYAAHPDIVYSLNHMTDVKSSKAILTVPLAAIYAQKRAVLGFSLFHAKSLLEAGLKGGNIKVLHPKYTVDVLAGNRKILKDMFENGPVGDAVRLLIRKGLRLAMPEDVGTEANFYAPLQEFADIMSGAVPFSKQAAATYIKANRIFDKITWEHVMTTLKVEASLKEMEKFIKRNEKDHQRNPQKYPLKSHEDIAEEVAEVINDTFGSQNWRRLIENTRTRFARKVKSELFSPAGREAMQVALFAPDWYISNARIAVKSLPFVSRTKQIARYHRMFALRTVALWMLGYNMVNYMFTGHFMWDNADPTTIELGDGWRINPDKQTQEIIAWLVHPGKSFLNKLGVVPSFPIEVATNQQWLSPNGAPPIYSKDDNILEKVGKVALHAGSKEVPITLKTLVEDRSGNLTPPTLRTTGRTLSGFIGNPMYPPVKSKSKKREY